MRYVSWYVPDISLEGLGREPKMFAETVVLSDVASDMQIFLYFDHSFYGRDLYRRTVLSVTSYGSSWSYTKRYKIIYEQIL